MAQYSVTCITKPNRESTHEYITHIGGSINGTRWKITREEAIRQIETKTNSFYVTDPTNPFKRSTVGVIRPALGYPYLRTYADGDWDNNLLSLTQCPI